MKNKQKQAAKSLYKIVKRIRLVAFDFDGVFTDNRVLVFDDGREAVLCSRADGLGLSKLRKIGIKTLVMSTETNSVVSTRCKKLGLHCLQSCENKLHMLKKETEHMGLKLSEVAYLGNDINDIECLKAVGLPCAVADAYPEVKRYAIYVTKKPGGYGAVREFCDYVTEIMTYGKH